MKRSLKSLNLPLLALVAFNLLPQIWLRPLWCSLLAGLFLGYRLAIELARFPAVPRLLIWAAQAASVALIWQEYHSIFGDEASGTLLTLLVGLKVHELRVKRDYFFTALLCFLVLMSYLLVDQSLFITAFMMVDVLLIVAFLFALESERFVTSGWLVPLRQAFVLSLKTVPLMALCFLLFPRFSTGFGAGEAAAAKTGVSDRLEPGSVSNLISSEELVFRASFVNGEVPHKNSLYWRGAVLDHSEGINWSRTPRMEDGQRRRTFSGRADIEVHLEPGFEKFVFAPEDAHLVFFAEGVAGHRISEREARVFQLDRPLKTRERYFIQQGYSPDGTSVEDHEEYLQTGEPLSQAGRQLIAGLQGESAIQSVRNILQYFRQNGYSYSMQPPPVAGMDEFLFQTKTGFCEHFAGTTATLLRHMHIPSRVVVGFQGGTPSFLENFISVRAHDAHAWVEYLDREGGEWRRIDPTAQVAPQRLTMGSSTYLRETSGWIARWFGGQEVYQKLRSFIDEVEGTWLGFLLRFDLARQKELLAWFGMEGAIFRALPVFLVLAIVLTLAFFYFIEAQRREALSTVDRLYRQLVRLLNRRWHIEPSPTDGPLSLMEKLRRRDPDLAEEVAPVLETLTLARFGGHELNRSDEERVSKQLNSLKKLSIKDQRR